MLVGGLGEEGEGEQKGESNRSGGGGWKQSEIGVACAGREGVKDELS